MILNDANYRDFLKEVEGQKVEEVKLGYAFIEIELSNGKTLKVESTDEKSTKHQEFTNLKLIIE